MSTGTYSQGDHGHAIKEFKRKSNYEISHRMEKFTGRGCNMGRRMIYAPLEPIIS